MSNITKWLGAIAGLLIIAEVAGPTLHGLFFQQLEQNQQQLTTVSRQLRIKELALRQAEATTRKFLERAQLNFEPDVARARLGYQEYLLRLSDACALNSVMVSSAQPERLDELGFIVHFSIQATGTTEQFGKMIDGFYRTEALHRLAHIKIFQSLGPDSPTHSLTLEGALLVLDSTASSTGALTLPPSGLYEDVFASHDIFRKRMAVSQTQPESSITSGIDMLSGLFNSLPAPPPEPPSPQPEASPAPPVLEEQPAIADPKANLRLVGIISNGSRKYAIFYDIGRELQHTLNEDSDLQELGINARVSQILPHDVRLIEADQQMELQLGKLYSEASKF